MWLRAGATPTLLDDLRAPSTVGSWLRSMTHGNVRQLDAVSRELRVRLWDAGAGPHRRDERCFVDVDSFVAQAFGPAKQGVSFGYTKVRGYHPLLATIVEPGGAPDVLATRLREGKANTARGATFHQRWDAHRYNHFRDAMNKLAADVREAGREREQQASISRWQKIFGPAY